MKKLIGIGLLLLLNFQGFVSGQTQLQLQEALEKGWVKVAIIANGNEASASSHYGKCMQFLFYNLTGRQLKIELPAGHMLLAEEDETQNMLLTQSLQVGLQPGQKRKGLVYAMCAELHDRSPHKNQRFSLGKLADPQLVGLARLIEEKKYQNGVAQGAVWALTDGRSPEKIEGEDPEMVENLKNYVYKALGRRKPVAAYGSKAVHRRYTLRGTVRVMAQQPGGLKIVLFNPAGEPVKEIGSYTVASPGMIRLTYQAGYSPLAVGVYSIRIMQGGEVLKSIPYQFN